MRHFVKFILVSAAQTAPRTEGVGRSEEEEEEEEERRKKKRRKSITNLGHTQNHESPTACVSHE